MVYDYEKGFADVLHLFADELKKAQGKSKRCSKCGQVKPIGEFNKHRRERDGLQSYCRVCNNTYAKAYREAHQEGKGVYNKAYYEAHRKQYKAYRDTHREERRSYYRAYAKAHEQELRNYKKEYYKAHQEEFKAQYKIAYETHPETFRVHLQRRRARKKALPHTLTTPEWELILEHYNHSCAYCGATEEEAGILHQEHVIPLSRGGGYTALNIVPACPSCNFRKGNKTPEEAGMKLRRIKLKQVEMF